MPTYDRAQVFLSIHARKTLVEDVHQRRHIEACGALLGHIDEQENWHVAEVYPLRNIHNSPVYFEFAPEDLLDVELTHPGQMVGVYHSHPTGFPAASATDQENMRRVNVEQQIAWIWLILSGPFTDDSGQAGNGGSHVPIIAYYHDPQSGLQQIPIRY